VRVLNDTSSRITTSPSSCPSLTQDTCWQMPCFETQHCKIPPRYAQLPLQRGLLDLPLCKRGDRGDFANRATQGEGTHNHACITSVEHYWVLYLLRRRHLVPPSSTKRLTRVRNPNVEPLAAPSENAVVESSVAHTAGRAHESLSSDQES
jgi:hypothetical protein